MAGARPGRAPPADPGRRQAPPAAGEPGAAAARSSSRICTGSTARRRRCSTAWSRACPRPGCCCWSATGPSTSMAGAARPTTRQLRLDPLPRRERRRAARRTPRDDPGLAPAQATPGRATEGNPFFLEESVRTLVETQALTGERGDYRLARRSRHPGPGTVQAILAARIDRLPPEDKRLLQIAAVIGKDVPFALLQAVADATGGGAPSRARPPAGGRVPLRDAPLSGSRVHLQARAHP